MTRQPKRPFHPRHLVCPRCGADVDHPCVFAGKEQAEVHCTERLKAIGDPSLRVNPAAKKPRPSKPEKPKPPAGGAEPPPQKPVEFFPTLF